MKIYKYCLLALLIFPGCTVHKPNATFQHGALLAEEYTRGENRAWCELQINGEAWQWPASWRLITDCQPVPETEEPYIVLTVLVPGGYERYLLSYVGGEVYTKSLGMDYDHYTWSSDQERIIIWSNFSPNYPHAVIYNPLTQEEILTKAFVFGRVLDLSPDYQSVLSGEYYIEKDGLWTLHVEGVDELSTTLTYQLDTTRYSVEDLSWALEDGKYRLVLPD